MDVQAARPGRGGRAAVAASEGAQPDRREGPRPRGGWK